MADRFVTLRHVMDPIEAEMLRDLLEQEGIPATIPGNQLNATYGGLLGAALQVPIQVPESQVGEARAILGALVDHDGLSEPGPGPHRAPPHEDDDRDAGVPERRPKIAVGAALILPFVIGAFGAGHFYARSTGRGVALLAAGWGCVLVGLGGASWAFLVLPLIVVLDAFGALSVIKAREAEARARRTRSARPRQRRVHEDE